MAQKNALPKQANVFEPGRLLQVLDGDLQAAREILAEAISAIQELVLKISSELAAGNVPSTLALAHELKGVAANVGAGELSSLSGTILERLRRSSKIQPQGALEDLLAAFNRFDNEASAFLS